MAQYEEKMKYFEQTIIELKEKMEFYTLLNAALKKMRESGQQLFSTYSVGMAMYGSKYDEGFTLVSGLAWRHMTDLQREKHKEERDFSLKAAARIGAALADLAQAKEIKQVYYLVRETGPSIYSF